MKLVVTIVFLFLLLPNLQSAEPEFGHKNLVEYIAGDLPIIIAAPHGGRIKEASISDRKSGVLTSDTNTDDLARKVYEAFKKNGKTPHLIICHLHRIKVDCNRSEKECYEGDEQALKVWKGFQSYIEKAKESILKNGQKVLYIDLHAHGHKIQRLELGYLISTKDLFKQGEAFKEKEKISSLKGLVNSAQFEDLIRGEKSLGTLMEKKGFPSVPSVKMKDAGKGNKYFRGGYNTVQHGAQKSKGCFAIQIECNWKGVRDSKKARMTFGDALSKCLLTFYDNYLK